MTKLDPIIAVKDVAASAEWYQRIFGFKNIHGGEHFAVLSTVDKADIILCLHKWGEDNHPSMADPKVPTGNGLILYFRTTDLEKIRKKVDELQCTIIEEVHLNPNSLRHEFSINDPDGYFLTVTDFHVYEG